MVEFVLFLATFGIKKLLVSKMEIMFLCALFYSPLLAKKIFILNI